MTQCTDPVEPLASLEQRAARADVTNEQIDELCHWTACLVAQLGSVPWTTPLGEAVTKTHDALRTLGRSEQVENTFHHLHREGTNPQRVQQG